MLSRPAATFGQQARLAASLSWIGGYVNVVVLIHTGMTVSHVTGNATHLGQLVVEARWPAAWLVAFLPLMFLLGAAVAGVCEQVAVRRRPPRSPFVLPVAFEAALLALLSLAIVCQDARALTADWWHAAAFYVVTGLGALAMGLQNATITRISGATVRTTHLTGVVTDLGTELAAIGFRLVDTVRHPRRTSGWRRAMRLIRRRLATRRLLLLAAIAGSFVVGVLFGTLVYETRPGLALVPPSLFLLSLVRVARRGPSASARDVGA